MRKLWMRNYRRGKHTSELHISLSVTRIGFVENVTKDGSFLRTLDIDGFQQSIRASVYVRLAIWRYVDRLISGIV